MLGLVFLGLVAFAVWVALLPSPRPGRPPIPDGFDPSGRYVLEKYLDPSLETPTVKLYLGDFQRSAALPNPNPWCTPTWYAVRYVRQRDGGYSALGPWTDLPVQAGVDAEDLPCPNGVCAGSIASGEDACRYNMPIVGNVDPLRYNYESDPGDPVWANVHRRTTPPRYDAAGQPDGDEGEIIGYLIPTNAMRLRGMCIDTPAAGTVQTAEECDTDVCKGIALPPPSGPCGTVPGAPALENPGNARCELDPEWLLYYNAAVADALDPLEIYEGLAPDECLATCKESEECAAAQIDFGTQQCLLYGELPRAYAEAGPNDIGAVLRAKLE